MDARTWVHTRLEAKTNLHNLLPFFLVGMELHNPVSANLSSITLLLPFKLKTVNNLKCFRESISLFPSSESTFSLILKIWDMGAKFLVFFYHRFYQPLPTITTASSDKTLGEMKSRLFICWKPDVDPAKTKKRKKKSPTVHQVVYLSVRVSFF